MKQRTIRLSDERDAALAAEAKEKGISFNTLVNLYLDQPLGENNQEVAPDIRLLLELIKKIDSRTEKMFRVVNHLPNESELKNVNHLPNESELKNVNHLPNESELKNVNHLPNESELKNVNHLPNESELKNEQNTPDKTSNVKSKKNNVDLELKKLADEIAARSAARRNLPAPLALIDVLKEKKEPEEPPLNDWYYKEIQHSSFSPDPNFDESMFSLIGPQDRHNQVVNYDFCRDTIRWNERVFTGEYEDQSSHNYLLNTPKDLNHEIAVWGEREWNKWQAAISHMPANNDIISIPLPENPKHQWMYVFLGAGPHITSREAFCGLLKQAYKKTHNERWKNPGNAIATLSTFSYATAMEILWPLLMTDRR